MKYELVYTRRAEKDIRQLEPEIRKKIGQTLLRFSSNPLLLAAKLSDPNLGSYRFRMGDHRVIFDLEGSEIVILRVGHRREIHKKR